MLCSHNVTLYYCEFKARMVSAPTGPFPNLYLDLSRHLHCLLCMQISPTDPTDHMIRSMCSILGMNTIVTMVCYCMCLSLIFQSLTLLSLFTSCILFKYFIFSLKQLLIDGQFMFSAFFVLLSILQVGLSKDYLKQS